jgi:peptidoglycan/xylan/chitin deacetylase (PgdA/CDA1 family)
MPKSAQATTLTAVRSVTSAGNRFLQATGQRRRKYPISILAFHAVSDQKDPYSVTPSNFRAQMQFLKSGYTVVPLQALETEMNDGFDERLVVLTFDDAYQDFIDNAAPVLEALKLPSTVFVPSGFIGGWNKWDRRINNVVQRRLMSARRIRTLSDSGCVEIGSHTIGHHRMTALSEEQMRLEAINSKAALEDITNKPLVSFAYPYGQLGDFSTTSTRVLQEAGYRYAVTTNWGTMQEPDGLLQLRRVRFWDNADEKNLSSIIEGDDDWRASKERVGWIYRTARNHLLKSIE